MEPVFEKGYPSYEAVNRRSAPMSEQEMIIYLHDKARTTDDFYLRLIADRFAAYVKAEKEARHSAVQG